MFSRSPVKAEPTANYSPAPGLEQDILELKGYGNCTLGWMDNGWYCSLRLFAPGQGVTLDVRSDFHHATPNAAVQQCLERAKATLATFK